MFECQLSSFEAKIQGVKGVEASRLFLEPHDLMTSKLYAGREKDMGFVATAIRNGIVDANLIRERINKVSGQEAMRDTVQARLERLL